MKPNTKRYLISIGVGLVIAFLIALSRGIFTESEANRILVTLNDAFFISGILLGCVGALLFLSNKGTFYMLSYGFSILFSFFRREGRDKTYRDFYEYKSAKEQHQHSCAYLLLVGLGFIAVSLILLIWVDLPAVV